MTEMLDAIVKNAEKANQPHEGDYIGEDGLLYCGKCHTPKQCRIVLPEGAGGGEQIVYCVCKCEKAKAAAEREAIKAGEREIYRRDIFRGGAGIGHTFVNDDGKNARLSKICRAYAEKYTPQSKWLLLYGGVGVGKSYLAACIVNALIDRDATAMFTSISEIERRLWNTESKAAVYDKLERVGLLVIDDLGAERGSEYMHEITFDVIDSRLRSGKPAVITTNLTAGEIFKPSDLSLQRVMSRVCERSIPVLCEGGDRRVTAMRESAGAALAELLG